MCDSVSHTSHTSPRDLTVFCSELRKLIHYFGGGFSDDDKAHHNSALSAFIVMKICLIESFNKAARIGGRNLHMTEVVRKPRTLHTGIASCKTCCRNLIGRS